MSMTKTVEEVKCQKKEAARMYSVLLVFQQPV